MIIQALLGGGWRDLLNTEGGDYACWLTKADLVQTANAIGSLTLDVTPDCPFIGEIAVNERVRASDGGEWEFYGRALQVTPYMEGDGRLGKEVVCEDALGFLADTAVQLDSTKKWFDGLNSGYSVEVDDDDGTRTLPATQLVEILINQHNSTIGDADGDKWKKVKRGTGLCKHDVTVSAEYEASTLDCLLDVADDTGCDLRYRYDGTSVYIDFGHSLGDSGGTFAVGDNVAKTAMEASMVGVVTRTFPFGETYAKLKKETKKATQVKGHLKGDEWSSKSGTMCRYDVSGALKAVITVGARNKDAAMVFFTDGGVSKKKTEVLKKYTTKKTTGANIVKRYPVPDGAKYCYVYGSKASGCKLTAYSHYTSAGEDIKLDYRVDLGFWLDYVRPSVRDELLDHYGLVLGHTTDDSGDALYYLQKNADLYGVVEGTCVKDNLLKTDKIDDAKKAVYSLQDLVTGSKKKQKSARLKAERFFRWACKKASKAAKGEATLTVDGYDLAEAGIGSGKVRLLGTWRVLNGKVGIDREARVLRIERDLLNPWDVQVELGKKASTATGAGWGRSELDAGSTAGSAATADKDDDDSAVDEYAALAGQYSELATEAAAEAVKSADELDGLSYRIQVDSLAAGQMADSAYDSVHPIVDAMNSALQDAEDRAHEITAVKESQSQTIETSNALARAVATYGYETEKSAVRWRQTYTASLDAWASDDEETQAKIQAAYAKLYGEGGTADNPTADSAQGHLVAAKAANVEATAKEAQMRTELASAKAYQESCAKAAQGAQESYDAAKANYDALKKKPTAERKRIDAALAALNGAVAKRDASQAAVDSADARCAEAEANYAAAKEELAAAEAKVERAQAEVDTAVKGIHELYSSTIEQTAKGFKLSAEKADELGKKVGELEVTADEISSTVSDQSGNIAKLSTKVDEISGTVENAATKSYVDQKADGVVTTITAKGYQTASQVDSAITSKGYQTSSQVQTTVSHTLESWKVSYTDIDGLSSYMSFSNNYGTGTLTLGGSSSSIVMGGSSSSISLCGGYGTIYASGGGVLMGGSRTYTTYSSSSMVMMCGSGSAILYDTGKLLVSDLVESSRQVNSQGAYMNTNIGPRVKDGASCGSSSYRWSAVYAKNGTIQSSSRKVKENIEPEAEEKAARLLDVEVVKFDYMEKFMAENRKGWYGVIAEDVHDAFPDAVLDWDVTGEVDELTGEPVEVYPGINYSAFVPHLIKLCQMQQRQIDALTERVAGLGA